MPFSYGYTNNRQFGVVIDAGSSGSRIQIYSWLQHDLARQDLRSKQKSLNRLPLVETGVPEGDGWHSRVEPGISSFAQRPSDIEEYLKPLLQHALEIIPEDRVKETPIFLLATAGMRLLPKAEQNAILRNACRYIQTNYSFRLKHCSENVRIISGEEEGLFGWVAVNYLMDGFDEHLHGDQHSSTYGFLDMGGASTQIAFEPSPSEQIKHADNLINVTLRNLDGRTLDHPVFVTTWLGYGTNQARSRYVDGLVDKFKSSPTNQAEQSQGLGTERLITTLEDPCLPKKLLLAEARHAGYMLQGTGDFEECVHGTSPLLNKDAPCLDDPCLFNGVHAPSIDFSVNRFIGISEYWYSTHDVFSMGGMYDFVSFERSAIDFCQQPWQEIVDAHSAGIKWKPSVELSRLEMQCFKAAWIVNILHEGIGIPRIVDEGGIGDGRNKSTEALEKADDKGFAVNVDGKAPSFQSMEHVGDVSISWTLGKMVLEVSQSVDATDSPTYFDKLQDSLPDWREGLKSGLDTIKKPTPIIIAPILISAVVLWFILWRCKSSRAFGGYFAPSRRRQDTTYTFDEADLSASKNRSSAFWRFLQRMTIWRSFRQDRADTVLPLHLSIPTSISPEHTGSPRPRILKHAASSPNLQGSAFYSSPNNSSASLPFSQERPTRGITPKPKWSLGLAKPSSSAFLRDRTASNFSNAEDEGFTTITYDSDAPLTPLPDDEVLDQGRMPASVIGRASSMRPVSRAASTTSLASGYFGRRKEKSVLEN